MPAGQCAQLRKLGVCLRACRGLFCAEIGLGPDVLYMIHPASRLEVILHSRADGRSAVKSAAYTARTTFRDARVGRRFSPGRKGGLLSHELINWTGNAEELWNAAERSERRTNARVIRELRPSLPRELPLPEQVRLVRSFCLWLRDKYGVAVQADIHAPRFLCPVEEKRHSAGKLELTREDYVQRLFNPSKTNLNFHAHILMTTRKVDRITGDFGEKTRVLDDRTSGPGEIKRIRGEWEKRTNAALRKIGSHARVDLRSYAEMVETGEPYWTQRTLWPSNRGTAFGNTRQPTHWKHFEHSGGRSESCNRPDNSARTRTETAEKAGRPPSTAQSGCRAAESGNQPKHGGRRGSFQLR